MRKDSRLLHVGAGNDSADIVAYDSLNLSNMGILHDVMLLIKDSKYIHAESKLSEIVNSNNIESNTMFALNLYLNYYVKNEIPDSSIYLKMEHIRHAHPFYNGKGVYILRGLMREDIIDELPAPSGVKSVPENKKSAQTAQVSGKLQPNPANNSVTVMLNQQLAENSILHVYNGMGLLIREIPMPKNTSTFEINTSDFKTGIYMICLTSNKNLLKFQRLVIIQ